MNVGDCVVAQFPIDLHPTLWQGRVVCGHIEKERHLIFILDHDFEVTDFAGLRLRVMRKGRRLGIGVGENEAYIFGDPDVENHFFSDEDFKSILSEGGMMCKRDRAKLGLERTDHDGLGPHRRIIGKFDPSAFRRTVEPSDVEVWMVVGSCDSAAVGDLVEALQYMGGGATDWPSLAMMS